MANEKIWTIEYVMSLPSVTNGTIEILEFPNKITRESKLKVNVGGTIKFMSARAIKDKNPKTTYKLRTAKYTLDEAINIVSNHGYTILSDTFVSVVSDMKIQCKKGHVFSRTLSKFNSGVTKCPECSKEHRTTLSKAASPYGFWTNEKFDLKLADKLPNHTRISDIINSRTKVRIKCPKGHLYDRSPDTMFSAISVLHDGSTRGCPTCSISMFEKTMSNFFRNNNIAYTTEESFNNSVKGYKGGTCRFDFYLPRYNLVVECDGHFHFSSETIINKGYKVPSGNFEKLCVPTIKNDKIKDLYCLNNNINLIRIPYFSLNTFNKLKCLINSNYKGISCMI